MKSGAKPVGGISLVIFVVALILSVGTILVGGLVLLVGGLSAGMAHASPSLMEVLLDYWPVVLPIILGAFSLIALGYRKYWMGLVLGLAAASILYTVSAHPLWFPPL